MANDIFVSGFPLKTSLVPEDELHVYDSVTGYDKKFKYSIIQALVESGNEDVYFRSLSIDELITKVKFKRFTGTTNFQNQLTIAHGIGSKTVIGLTGIVDVSSNDRVDRPMTKDGTNIYLYVGDTGGDYQYECLLVYLF